MKIKELTNKFRNAASDTILVRDIELDVKVTFLPKDPLIKYTILEDETGTLEAVPSTKKIFKSLKDYILNGKKLKVKGRLDKTGFGNIAFEIEEILE